MRHAVTHYRMIQGSNLPVNLAEGPFFSLLFPCDHTHFPITKHGG